MRYEGFVVEAYFLLRDKDRHGINYACFIAHNKNNLNIFGGYYYEKSSFSSGSGSDDCWPDWLPGSARRRKTKTRRCY